MNKIETDMDQTDSCHKGWGLRDWIKNVKGLTTNT